MSQTRTVKKSKGGVQDLLLGKGSVLQDRAGGTYTIDKLDVPVALDTVAEMQALDVAEFTRARVYSSTTAYVEYIYDESDATGISPDDGKGSWRLAHHGVEGTEAELTTGAEVKQRWWSPRTLARWVVQFFIHNVATVVDLRNLEPLIDGQQINLLGHTNPGVGGGTFYYASLLVGGDDNGNRIVTVGGKVWVRESKGFTTPEDFGGGIGEDDTTPIIAASATGKSVICGAGVYSFSGFGDTTTAIRLEVQDKATVQAVGVTDRFIGLKNGGSISLGGTGAITGYREFIRLLAGVGDTIPKIVVEDLDLSGNDILGIHGDRCTVNRVLIANTTAIGIWSGFSFAVDILSSLVHGNRIENASVPLGETIGFLVGCGFRFGEFQSALSGDMIFTSNSLIGIEDQNAGRDVNGIRALGKKIVIADNIISDLTSGATVSPNMEGIYTYTNDVIISNNVLSNAGRNEASIACKGPQLGGNALITGNVISHDDTLTDSAGGILVDADRVKVSGNTLLNVGRLTNDREQWGAIVVNKEHEVDNTEISDNYILCRGVVGIAAMSHGNYLTIKNNTVIVNSEMDTVGTTNRFGIISSWQDTIGAAYDNGTIVISGNYVEVTGVGSPSRSAAISRFRYYGASSTTVTDRLLIKDNILRAREAYHISSYGGTATYNSISFSGNDYSAIGGNIFGFMTVAGINSTTLDGYRISKTTYAGSTVPAGGSVSTVINLAGVRFGDVVAASSSFFDTELDVQSRVFDVDKVYIDFVNIGGVSVVIPASTDIVVEARRIV